MSDTERERLLAQFARKTEETKEEVAATDGEQYEAFKPLNRRQVSLHIRPVGEPLLAAKYGYLLYVVTAPSGRRLDVAFSFALVTIKGRNLREIGNAIADEHCAFVQQFDPKQWPKPKDDSAPLIEAIAYMMTTPQDVTGEKEETT